MQRLRFSFSSHEHRAQKKELDAVDLFGKWLLEAGVREQGARQGSRSLLMEVGGAGSPGLFLPSDARF